MSVLTSRPALRWLVPAAAAAAVIGGGAAIGTFAANAEPALPERSAAQLLVDLQTARLDGLSGTVVQQADLGLPSLPGLGGGGQGSADLASLVSGTNTLRVWYAGPDQARVALMGTLGETDVIRNGNDVWVWSSRENTATHRKLSGDEATRRPEALPSGLPSTPQEAADAALKAVDPTTKVTTGRSATVAGRDAYELILSPRDTASLVGQVRLAIDAKEHVPLRVEVFAKGVDEPAIKVAFTQVDFARPDAQQFRFNPPPGAKVTEESATDPRQSGSALGKDEQDRGEQGRRDAAGGPTVVGEGWTSVLVMKAPTGDAEAPQQARPDEAEGRQQIDALLGQLQQVNGAWGSGRLLSGKLFSVLLTDDGRVLVGAVAPEKLYEVAATKAGR